MTAIEFLEQYKEAQQIANRLKAEYEKESEILDSITSPLGSDGMPRSGKISQSTERKAVKLAEKLTEYEEAQLDALRIKRDVFRIVNMVPGDSGDVLYERYIKLSSWRQIADNLGYSERQCYNLRNEGLDVVKELIK